MLTIAFLLAAANPAPGVAGLGWMSGAWRAPAKTGAWAEEYWTPPRGWVMIGAGFTGREPGVARLFEHMRIAAGKDGQIAFHGMPGGAKAVVFPLVSQTATEIIFENPAHDYPQRISYARDGELLVATVSLIDGSQMESWRYRRAN